MDAAWVGLRKNELLAQPGPFPSFAAQTHLHQTRQWVSNGKKEPFLPGKAAFLLHTSSRRRIQLIPRLPPAAMEDAGSEGPNPNQGKDLKAIPLPPFPCPSLLRLSCLVAPSPQRHPAPIPYLWDGTQRMLPKGGCIPPAPSIGGLASIDTPTFLELVWTFSKDGNGSIGNWAGGKGRAKERGRKSATKVTSSGAIGNHVCLSVRCLQRPWCSPGWKRDGYHGNVGTGQVGMAVSCQKVDGEGTLGSSSPRAADGMMPGASHSGFPASQPASTARLRLVAPSAFTVDLGPP